MRNSSALTNYQDLDRVFLPHQRHHHTKQGRFQGFLGEHAKPDIPFEEGGRAEATGNILQRGHAQVSGELSQPQKFLLPAKVFFLMKDCRNTMTLYKNQLMLDKMLWNY